MLALLEEALGNNDRVVVAVSVAVHACNVLLAIKVDGLRLAREDHGGVVEARGCDAGNANARGLDGQNLVDRPAGKAPRPLVTHVRVQRDIALVIEKAVHLEHIALADDALLLDPLLELPHAIPVSSVPDVHPIVRIASKLNAASCGDLS